MFRKASFRKASFLAVALGLTVIGTALAPAALAQTKPTSTQGGCGARPFIPALGAALDELLPAARLSAADAGKVTVMRELIRELSASGKEGSARDVEEIAMSRLGYTKLWLRCGTGTFNWINQAGNEATKTQ
jgi:hypothetical protein